MICERTKTGTGICRTCRTGFAAAPLLLSRVLVVRCTIVLCEHYVTHGFTKNLALCEHRSLRVPDRYRMNSRKPNFVKDQ